MAASNANSASGKPDYSIQVQQLGDEPPVEAWRVNFDWRTAWLRAVAKAWQSDEFKRRLVSDPAAAFTELGFTYLQSDFLRQQLEVVVLDYTDKGSLEIERDPDHPPKAQGERDLTEAVQLVAMPGLRYAPEPSPSKDDAASTLSSFGGGNSEKPRATNGWAHFGPNLKQTLVLRLPPKPKKVDEVALALADYDAAGRVYTMTIC